MVGRVPNHCCHAKVKIRVLFAVGVDVTVDSTDVFGVAMDMQKHIVVEQQHISNNNWKYYEDMFFFFFLRHAP
jgi:hypothetical protein